MYFIVYKITNKINNKEYIGTHKTSNLSDDYMGSGVHLKRAKEKYGLENFSKEIIFRAVSSDVMYFIERMLVDDGYVYRGNTYNLKLGGCGGFDYINSNGLNNNGDRRYVERNKKISSTMLNQYKTGERISPFIKLHKEGKINYCTTLGMIFGPHSEETRKLMQEKSKGEKNSQFGSMWIYNLELKENKKVPKGDSIPDGWLKGRKMKF